MIKHYFARKRKNGFTMIEILIVLSIVGMFSTVGVVSLQSSQGRARDGRRKSDLSEIKVALENYYNDNNCYPTSTDVFAQCGQPFKTYLNKIPCDPITREPYAYVPMTNACKGYRLYTTLEDENDSAITQAGCTGAEGCGYGAANYGIAAGTTVFFAGGTTGPGGASPTPGVTPSPTSTPYVPLYVYACDSSGTCNRYEPGSPYLYSCPVTFEQTNCNNECGNPALRCQ